MGYYIRRLPMKKSIPCWKIQFVSGKRKHARNTSTLYPRRTWDIPQERWAELGIHKHLTLQDAVTRQRQLNAQLSIKRREERRLVLEEREKIFAEKTAGFIPTIYSCD